MLLVGNIALISGVAMLLVHVSAGHELTTRPFIALVAGSIIAMLGYRVASGSFGGASQVPHFGAALGAFTFLASLPLALARGQRLPSAGHLWPCTLVSMLVIASWYFRARRRKRRRPAAGTSA